MTQQEWFDQRNGLHALWERLTRASAEIAMAQDYSLKRLRGVSELDSSVRFAIDATRDAALLALNTLNEHEAKKCPTATSTTAASAVPSKDQVATNAAAAGAT